MPNKFNLYIELSWDRDHSLRVVGEAEPYVPARTNCSNDNACPAEGGGFEVHAVYVQRGDKSKGTFRERKISEDMLDKLANDDRFISEVERELDESSEDNGPDYDREDD